MSTPVTAIPGTFPAGFCPQSPQEFYTEFFRISSWNVASDFTGVIKSNTQPDADNTDKVWYRLNADSSPDKIFIYYNGTWVSPHAVPASSQEIRIWSGNLTALDTYDGGAAGVVTDLSGPMWERATDYDGRFLLGAGTLDGTGDTVNIGDEGGSDQVTLTEANLPTHVVQTKVNRTGTDDLTGAFTGGAGTPQPDPELATITLDSEPVGSDVPTSTIPPYKTIYWIQRTARIYHTP